MQTHKPNPILWVGRLVSWIGWIGRVPKYQYTHMGQCVRDHEDPEGPVPRGRRRGSQYLPTSDNLVNYNFSRNAERARAVPDEVARYALRYRALYFTR